MNHYTTFSSNPVNVENYKPGTSGGIGGVGVDGGVGPFFFPAKYQITKPTTITATIIQKRVMVLYEITKFLRKYEKSTLKMNRLIYFIFLFFSLSSGQLTYKYLPRP